MSESAGELVPQSVTQQVGFVIPDNWDVDNKSGQFRTTYDMTLPDGKLGVLRHLNDLADKPEDWINKEFTLTHFTLQPVMFESRQNPGEEVKTIRTVLEDENGKIVQFVSMGVVKSLMQIVGIVGAPPWKPALRLKLIRRTFGADRSGYQLQYIPQTSKARKS